MLRKAIILLGSVAIILSLMNPIAKTVSSNPNQWVEGWGEKPRTQQTRQVTDYNATTYRTIAILVGTITVLVFLPKPKS